ncbi:glutamate racemase [Peribacillus deserti]|uniref:Glutamate racemase n=1 Tax=Peribacillus deserti TaxID=673318 RepID=A0ABS2QFP6_9BACI|nr:glutamate racemase [Peribacillus deserti]MBM7691983.1 glutamate racemase [Peribacillus deserti]
MKHPIGIIDSGVGGLTVAKEVMRQLPHENIIYLGDTARCPYGPRPMDEVKQFTWQMTRFLLNRNIKMLIIACNTATAAVLDEIRNELSIPVLGVIYPGARAALKLTRNLNIGVLGTAGTIKSGAYETALKNINPLTRVESLACPKFVSIVESGQFNSPIAKKVVAETLKSLKSKKLDTLILGCTHYPLLGPVISSYMGKNIEVISSGEETASEASVILHYNGHMNKSSEPPVYKFYTTGSKGIFQKIASEWLERTIHEVETVKIDQ